jgi:hypothetical protein
MLRVSAENACAALIAVKSSRSTAPALRALYPGYGFGFLAPAVPPPVLGAALCCIAP